MMCVLFEPVFHCFKYFHYSTLLSIYVFVTWLIHNTCNLAFLRRIQLKNIRGLTK